MTLNLLQHWFCFVFCFLLFYFFDPEPWEILAPRSGTEPIPDTLEGKVLTTGPPGKPTSWTFLSEIGIFFNLKYMIIKNIITTNYCSLLLLLIGTHWSTSGFQLQSLLEHCECNCQHGEKEEKKVLILANSFDLTDTLIRYQRPLRLLL